jgi:hypothetical protein
MDYFERKEKEAFRKHNDVVREVAKGRLLEASG